MLDESGSSNRPASGRKASRRTYNLTVVVAVFCVWGSLAGLARLPDPLPGETAGLAARFKFALHTLPPNPIPAGGVAFPVNKTAAHMGFYLYQIGASAALGDLDGDGLPNDLCLTDVRAKTAIVRPVPGTGTRYEPFVLNFGKLFDQVREWPSVCRIADMNEDGLEDIFVAFYGRPPLLLLRRNAADLKPHSPISMDSFTVTELAPGLSQRWWTATANE